MSLVFVVATTAVGLDGAVYTLREGEPWDADDRLVKERPDMFTTEPPKVRTSTGWVRRTPKGVEQATAAPGQKRNR